MKYVVYNENNDRYLGDIKTNEIIVSGNYNTAEYVIEQADKKLRRSDFKLLNFEIKEYDPAIKYKLFFIKDRGYTISDFIADIAKIWHNATEEDVKLISEIVAGKRNAAEFRKYIEDIENGSSISTEPPNKCDGYIGRYNGIEITENKGE